MDDLMAIWNSIDSRIDWLLAGIVGLLILNILLPLYVGWMYMNLQSFHSKYNLQKSAIFVEKAKKLEDIPTMDEVEIDPPAGQKPLPDQYVALKQTDLFLPAGSSDVVLEQSTPSDGPDTEDKDIEPQQPPISGYEIVGRITGKGDIKASVIRKLATGSEGTSPGGVSGQSTYIAREGDYLENSDVQVVDISDTSVRLDKPGHRVTTFQFEIDEISQRIRQSIILQ